MGESIVDLLAKQINQKSKCCQVLFIYTLTQKSRENRHKIIVVKRVEFCVDILFEQNLDNIFSWIIYKSFLLNRAFDIMHYLSTYTPIYIAIFIKLYFRIFILIWYIGSISIQVIGFEVNLAVFTELEGI